MILADRSRRGLRLLYLAIGLSGLLVLMPTLAWHVRANEQPVKSIKPAAKVSPPQAASLPKLPIDTTIVPGQRVGVITSQTKYTDLVKIFGKQRLNYKKVYGAEGQVSFPGTVITLGRNKSLTIAWKDPKQTQPLFVEIKDAAYKTTSGIGLGTSLDKLRQILGEFKITGLYWDYGNTVIDLSPATQARYTGLSIHVDADRFAAKQFPKQLRAVTGDGVNPRSSDPNWKPLKISVSGLIVYFLDRKSTALNN
jgi:hypothetical protein